MALTNSQHDAIMRTYDAIRTENRHIQNERYAQVTAACPEIAQIEDDIIGLSMAGGGRNVKKSGLQDRLPEKAFRTWQTVKPPVLPLLADLRTI